MKRLILQLLLICQALGVYAQREIFVKDANFTFRPGFSSEKQWMIMRKADTAKSYAFGFTYVDQSVGFVFQQAGTFKMGADSSFVLDAASVHQKYPRIITHNYKAFHASIMLWPMAVIKPDHYKELQINGEPGWLKQYYTYTDTLEHNYLWGTIHSHIGDYYVAIAYFQKVLKVAPHYKDVELNMGFAYNRSEQFHRAIPFLNAAIANSPRNLRFYNELSRSYELQEDWQTCIDICKRGLIYATADKYEPQSWLAVAIGNAYQRLNNTAEANAWWAKGRAYDPNPGRGMP